MDGPSSTLRKQGTEAARALPPLAVLQGTRVSESDSRGRHDDGRHSLAVLGRS